MDFIEAVPNAIQKRMIQRKLMRMNQNHQPSKQMIQAFHPIIGFVINVLKMPIAQMVYARAVMAGMAMATNANTNAQSPSSGKMIDAYKQVMKMNVSMHNIK